MKLGNRTKKIYTDYLRHYPPFPRTNPYPTNLPQNKEQKKQIILKPFLGFFKCQPFLLLTIIVCKSMSLISNLRQQTICLIIHQIKFLNTSMLPDIQFFSYSRIRLFTLLPNMGLLPRFSFPKRCKLHF